jgi:hypothetical protein
VATTIFKTGQFADEASLSGFSLAMCFEQNRDMA